MNRSLRYTTLLAAVVIFAAVETSFSRTPAQSRKNKAANVNAQARPPAHPVVLQADTPAATCLECHGDLEKGKYVHAAMSMGCGTCHAIDTKGGVTHVTLVLTANQLCEKCHPLSSNQVLHGPYRDGLCVKCHSPHSSDYPAHLWASAQDTCLGCHARARLKVNQKAKTVTTPWGKTLTFAQMKGWQFLNLNSTLTGNHPVAGHPVSGPNRKPDLPQVSCLSCHKTHSSNFKNLVTAGPPADMPLCATCGVCAQCHESMY